jgi:site-specific recombinase XerD
MSHRVSPSFQVRRALLRSLAPRYQQASPAQKTLLLDSFVEWTGYTRKYAIALLNHGKHDQQTIQRRRLPQYSQEVQQALFLAWKATHNVCAKRLLPSLPSLVALLEGHGHLQLTEEERRQLLAMGLSTAERFLRTQRKPRLHGLSTTSPGPLCRVQIPVRTFSQWEENRPGFVEIDLVAHCGDHLDGRFLYTLTLTDLATGWTECLPLLEKSADAVLAALAQARTLFPFPLLGIDTDSGAEFLNAEVIAYCEQEQLTFTRGRPAVKNDQCHVEQKNGAVVRKAVGCARLVGVQAYQQLHEVYQVLRMVVNCFQPSLKLQAKVREGEQVRRVYDAAQTPLLRLLASGVLSEDRQRELREQVQQIDPLALCEQLDALRYALLCGADGRALPQPGLSLALCTSVPLLASEEEPERTDLQEAPSSSKEIGCLALGRVVSAPIETLIHGPGTICPHLRANLEEPWPPELIQGDPLEPLPTKPHLPEEAVSATDQSSELTQPTSSLAPCMPSSTTGDYEAGHLEPTTFEQAIAAYVQEIRACGRDPKTLRWHQISLGALRRYLWRQFHLTDVRELSRTCLQGWVTDLHILPSPRTGATRSVNTVVAYARSARAFCNWLVRQGYVSETPFPKDAVPQAQRRRPQPVEPEVFVHLLHACQHAGSRGKHNAGMAARNRAILWLLRDTGLQVSELCCLRLADVDRASGTVTVRGKSGHLRTFSLSADGQRAMGAYLDQARLTPAWEPAVSDAQDLLLLTERRHPLTKNSLTLLFLRLSQRAGFTKVPICPSMLRDTYAIRFLQTGGELAALQEQLGVAALASVKRYQHFFEQRKEERQAWACREESLSTRLSQRGKRKRRQEHRPGRGLRLSQR